MYRNCWNTVQWVHLLLHIIKNTSLSRFLLLPQMAIRKNEDPVNSASTSAMATSKRQIASNVLRKLGRFALCTLKNSPVRYLGSQLGRLLNVYFVKLGAFYSLKILVRKSLIVCLHALVHQQLQEPLTADLGRKGSH